MLARAVLELSEQVVRLRSRVFSTADSTLPATIVQLCGGGGQLTCPTSFPSGQLLELTLQDDDDGTPPVRAIVEIIHQQGVAHIRGGVEVLHGQGFRLAVIHDLDQDRLMRLIYSLQRRAIHAAHTDN